MSPGDLKEALKWLPADQADELIIGFDTSDDAAVYKFDDKLALLQTVDFFPPIVDSPYMFGQIAAANALSDIYAMGGKPLTALNLVAYPCKLGMDLLGEILQGGHNKVKEAGALTVGGHSIQDNEPKYGLSVTGVVPVDKIVANSTAQDGDMLVFTKPLGMGILASALKKGAVTEDDIADAINTAATLNKAASEAMVEVGVNACTDVTGFGLMGHLREMTLGSKKKAVVEMGKIPVWELAIDLAKRDMVPGGAKANRAFLEDVVMLPANPLFPEDILFDPQTSGGLLISVSAAKLDMLLTKLKEKNVMTHAVIGRIEQGEPGLIEVKS
jgi:selenide, water dikinase